MAVSTTQIREWMDIQVRAYKDARTRLIVNDEGDYLSNISIHGDGIHLTSDDLRFIVKKLSLDLCVKSRGNDEDYPYQVFVIYKDTVFFDIESEADYQRLGAVI